MTAREWQPGDVALVTVDGVERPAVRSADGRKWIVEPQPSASRRVTESARALVVIDPEDEDDRLRLANALHRAADAPLIRTDRIAYALREFVDPTPPRIDEPGTWGVVKASCPHSDTRREWVHHPDGNWWPAFDYSTVPERTPLPDDWADLIDPVLVREGVTQ